MDLYIFYVIKTTLINLTLTLYVKVFQLGVINNVHCEYIVTLELGYM